MVTPQRQIRDGGMLVPIGVPEGAAPATLRPIGPDFTPEPAPSPARVLQEKLQASTSARVKLPRPVSRRRELTTFVVCAIVLWGAALAGIAGLMVLAS